MIKRNKILISRFEFITHIEGRDMNIYSIINHAHIHFSEKHSLNWFLSNSRKIKCYNVTDQQKYIGFSSLKKIIW